MALRLRDSEVTSSSAARTGMRRVRSPPAMAAAVSSIWVSGRKARRTANQPSRADPASTSALRAPVVTRRRATVCLTERSGTPTAKVASFLPTVPAMNRQSISPSTDCTVKGLPLRTRGSPRASRGTSGCIRSVVGLTLIVSPSTGKRTNA